MYLWGAKPRVTPDREGLNPPLDAYRFAYGNYFNTEEEAESMAEKISKVLNGADVIEMPSEEEIKQASYDCTNGYDDDQIPGFKEGVEWLKSKIVK